MAIRIVLVLLLLCTPSSSMVYAFLPGGRIQMLDSYNGGQSGMTPGTSDSCPLPTSCALVSIVGV